MEGNFAPATGAHGALMNSVYRSQRHIYDLTRKYYLLGRDQLIAGLDATQNIEVLEVGCGTGRNLIAAARRWPHARFTGIDISAAMLETAHASLKRHRLEKRIALAEADACDFISEAELANRKFDRIFFSYALSMIPAWEYAIEEALSALVPEGSLHIVDFGQQERLPGIFRTALFAWLRHFHVTPRADLRAVLEDAAQRHGRRLEFRPLYRGYAWKAVLR